MCTLVYLATSWKNQPFILSLDTLPRFSCRNLYSLFISTYIIWHIPQINGQTFRNGAECCWFTDLSNTMGLPVKFQLTELSGSYNARYHSLYCISYIHEVLIYSEAPLQLMVKLLSHLTRIKNTPSIRRTESTRKNPKQMFVFCRSGCNV